ncbi:TetR/AcrR family transcriptional regulator [Mycobacterium sp. MYCO198283]|uniref:TetR/AcrR family transcriptional regulator n=1 Tax=Mycobacterium sp. MYCO198283 TaxID=2883505 RepID=UPI001E43C9CF|nr:TetR/AcrR family transcriptional regulator [Mycobacterium sp. MYCO198283]MCG5434437.1 TetR/AcrR family transcriptional regulator [Mycobacterium sp. MYCO198283]
MAQRPAPQQTSPQQPTAKRQRRQRGSINPDDIVAGAFELAQTTSIDNLSMPALGRHLSVGVTSIYWYFRSKDDLLNAMADRALQQVSIDAPHVAAAEWRESLHAHAHALRSTFKSNAILTDLVLIRGALSASGRRLGVRSIEAAVAGLVEAGLSPEDAYDTYSAVSLHVRGSVVLSRLDERARTLHRLTRSPDEPSPIDPATTPLVADLSHRGHRLGVADDANFEYGLQCILDHAAHLIAQRRA